MTSWRRLIVVPAAALTLASPVAASPILGLDFASDDATVVWDGSATVATSNNLGILGTNTGVYGALGLSDPSDLVVRLALTGVPTVQINRLALIFSALNGPCAGCVSIAQAMTTLQLPFPGQGNLVALVIPFFAVLQGPSVAQSGDLFRLSAADQNQLRRLLLQPGFGPNQLVVGLSVNSDRQPIPGGGFVGSEVFTVTAVPEPATLLLVASGAGLLAARRRRARC